MKSAYQSGSSVLKRTPSLPEGDDIHQVAAYEGRECNTHSRRVSDLLGRCWERYYAEDKEGLSGEAARAARAMLQQMGHGADVERWEERSRKFEAIPPAVKMAMRGANARRGEGY